ncbi:MAG: RagB/SusD family nutrient uptake outer membrane protein [Prevotella bivia]|uniref:RagB/SusD family nutrient uptake outer membrane protein n=1 Tax=Prevotella bivia TaxID=28125 RepID=UPI00254EDA9C|nr:RagB/SusD family nutrient uptake outer membrane protein [Prevotella bivia]MDU2329804.1 RagB/SusD family nutrient uptake outer membrane protein [Prevotella bivia]MDU7315836.1 RagB/SusD family nutrient uptake outer membrane protein [Prevotella bivia]MDZ3818521.1 RagB/SusD family nutrient uptake outer membrane protein [Prevotella bivia]
MRINIINKATVAVAVFTCVAAFSSCDKYLDIQPVGKVIPTTVDDYRALLNEAYQMPQIDRAVVDFRSDIVVVRDNDTDMNDYHNIQTWNDNNTLAGTREFGWEVYYSPIYTANAIIEAQGKIKGNTTDINQLVGEAYLLRAYNHFTLVNLYGQPYTKSGAPETKAIPIKTSTDLETTPERNTVGEVYTQILSDIAEARKLITQGSWEERYKYRYSTVSVDALEARVRLYMGDWQSAYDAAERVLKANDKLEDFNNAASLLPTSFKSVEAITSAEQFYTGTNASATRAPKEFIAEYDTINDLRYKKFYQPVKDKPYFSTLKANTSSEYRCSFHTAEFYLIAAEAAAHLNKDAEARTRLLALLKNRLNSTLYATKQSAINAMSGAALLAEVMQQRKLELAFEGQRWFDLRRTNRPAITKTIKATTYNLLQDDPRYTLAIPVSAVSANPQLKN